MNNEGDNSDHDESVKDSFKVNNLGKQMSKQATDFYIDLVKKAQREYQTDLEKQAEFIKFFGASKFGKEVQVFIFNYELARAGHHFYVNTGHFIEIIYNKHIYYMWRVELQSDAP